MDRQEETVRRALAREGFSPARAEREIERARELGAAILPIEDERYPASLRFIFDPPSLLYVRGELLPQDVLAVAVIGSRRASAYGATAADTLARELAALGVSVVSGLAVGIDAAAHRGALAAGGRTIAVLGSGIDDMYPARHAALAGEIALSGAVVSELPLGAPPKPHHFPRRNRIVAGLAQAVVVVEAGEKSGSLITARLALEQGRAVMAVPGEIGLFRTRGVHRLIRQGATLVESGRDVVDEILPWLLGPEPGPPALPRPAAPSSPDAARLLSAFESTVEHVDRLIERSGLPASRVLGLLLELELTGEVAPHPGMFYARRKGG